MKIEIEVAIITAVILAGIIGIFYLVVFLPWEFYFQCIGNGMIPSGDRSEHSCHQLEDYLFMLFYEE
ncbi:hypothetical protein [Nitrosopumilus sp.]|uniref:hypothetical protein n=1 Tax=Nitrosopumilus sp. TaxID=2024843 RepID=UPI002610835E|nr:hypothetical protein [Nitrosopumilus sp.]